MRDDAELRRALDVLRQQPMAPPRTRDGVLEKLVADLQKVVGALELVAAGQVAIYAQQEKILAQLKRLE